MNKRTLVYIVSLFFITSIALFENSILAFLENYLNHNSVLALKSVVFDGFYFVILVFNGVLAVKFSRENYGFNNISYIFSAFLFGITIAAVFLLPNGNQKDIIIACWSFLPALAIVSVFSDYALKYVLSLKIVDKKGVIEVLGIFTLLIIAAITYILKLHTYIMFYYCFLYFYGVYTKEGELKNKYKYLFRLFFIFVITYVYLNKIVFSFKNMSLNNIGYDTYVIVGVYLLWIGIISFSETLGRSKICENVNKLGFITKSDKDRFIVGENYYISIRNHIVSTILMFVIICGIEATIRLMALNSLSREAVLNVLGYFVSGTFFYNFFMLYCIVNIIYAFLGRNFTLLIISIGTVVYIVANIIKLHFHNSVFKLLDILLVREMFLMAESYIGLWGVWALSILAILILIIIIVNIKSIIKFLKPQPKMGYAMAAISLMAFFVFAVHADIIKEMPESPNETSDYINEGVFVYNYENIEDSKQTLFPDVPQDYSKENIERIKSNTPEAVVSDTNPDVIVILVESYFDINQVEEFKLNKDVMPVYRKYGKGNIVSPYYGGESAAIEFEMMTGLSNYYILEGIIPYTLYFDGENYFPSIVGEFKNNGYETNVIQPVAPEFYNSKNAYKSMGVDNFYSLNDLKDLSNDMAYIPDSEIGKKLISIAKEEDKPQFILAVTMEEHSPYKGKYSETDIKIESASDNINDSDKEDITQYSQSIANGSKMIEDVIKYIDSSDKPTLLYVFGDHLPPLSPLKKTEIINNIWTKYQTPLIAYSNYKDIDFGQDNVKITPNQLAPQILRDAEIKHNSYFDYIYSLRNNYPVVHKEFLSDEDKDKLRDYYLIQYDIIFGEKYVLE